MFQNLSSRLSHIFDGLRGRGSLSEADVLAALREIRIALLEADVALSVVKSFIEAVRLQAIGHEVLKSITPGQMVVKIVHDHLITLLSHPKIAFNLQGVPPVVIMCVGLQGSGKTTMTAKLAFLLAKQHNQKVLMASLDVYRPAAQEQLAILGQQIGVATLPIVSQEKPLEITKRALEHARLEGMDVLLLDTAGRLHIDEALMTEVQDIKALSKPLETLLIADAMTGQDAVRIAQTFHDRLKITGIALSRMDGDARGGAALSMCAVTQQPLKFLGTGERPDQLEVFHPKRVADRILGMGDIVTLVEKAALALDEKEVKELSARMEKGVFTLDDMAKQIKQLSKMGGISTILNFLPGMGNIKEKISQANGNEKIIPKQLAILSSMTQKERQYPKLLNASRKRRVALGSGTSVPEINRLLKQYEQMASLMKKMGKMDKKKFMRQGFSNLFHK